MAGNTAFDKSLRHAIATSMFLLKRVPRNSIVSENCGDEHFQPASMVVDPESQKRLAYVESISANSDKDLPQLASDYADFFKRTGLVLPVYLIRQSTTDGDDSKVRAFRLSDKLIWEKINAAAFPTLDELRNLKDTPIKNSFPVKSVFDWLLKFLEVIAGGLIIAGLAKYFGWV